MGELRSSAQFSELVRQLHQAAETGGLGQIQCLLSNLEAEQCNSLLRSVEVSTGQLPFHSAARGGHIEILGLLLPETVQDLINTPTKQGGWSCLHLAAAHGHVRVVQWLCATGMADLNLKGEEGNTPLHLAVVLGHKDVVRCLVTAGANLFSLNNDKMMPFSLCKDAAMFEALFSNYTSSPTISVNSARPSIQSSWPVDAEGKSFLHYAAQFANDPDGIVKLISELEMEQLQGTDNREDTFLHVAAKSGNMQVLHALRKADVDINQLLSISRYDPRSLDPALCALLNNHQEFYDALIGMSTVKITLRCIIRGLLAELWDKPKIEDRLGPFAETLPTYLALYANKICIFNFLLKSEIVDLSQWDDEHKRTCLHWAVLDKRNDIVEHLGGNAQVRPGIQDVGGKTVLQLAFEDKNHAILDILRSKRGFKDYEKQLDRDREIYVQALNAILVGAALIGGVTFAGWLQLPSSDFDSLSMKVFYVSNCVSFFTAMATMCITTTALLPTPSKYVGDIVNELRVAIVMDGALLALSLAAVMWAFAAAGFAALEGFDASVSQNSMRITTALGGLLCLFVWLACVFELSKRAPQRSVIFALIFPSALGSFLKRWFPSSFQRVRAHIGASSRYSYHVTSKYAFMSIMDEDLVAKEPSPSSNIIPLPKMQQVVGKFDVADTGIIFLEHTYKHKTNDIASKERKEGATKRIVHDFSNTRTLSIAKKSKDQPHHHS